jgi:hypothetical protein
MALRISFSAPFLFTALSSGYFWIHVLKIALSLTGLSAFFTVNPRQLLTLLSALLNTCAGSLAAKFLCDLHDCRHPKTMLSDKSPVLFLPIMLTLLTSCNGEGVGTVGQLFQQEYQERCLLGTAPQSWYTLPSKRK